MITCTWCGCGINSAHQWWWELDYISGTHEAKHDEVCQRCGDGSGLKRIDGTYTTNERCIKHPHTFDAEFVLINFTTKAAPNDALER